MKNYILIGIIIAVFIVSGVYIYQNKPESQPTTRQFQQNQEEKILEVQLEILAPFSIATLSVGNQGIISYEAEAPRTGQGIDIEKQVDSIKITERQFNDLSYIITQNNFWSFDERYSDDNLMDAKTYTISVKSASTHQPELTDARVHSVSCYGDCPEGVIEIINKIKELWGKEILEVGV